VTILKTFRLAHDAARRGVGAFAMQAPDGTVVQFKEPTRTSDQNAKFHAICSDLAKSQVTWAGKRRDAAAWKVLLVSGHATATKEGSEMVPGLEGEFVNLRESTALMSKKRGSSLIDYSLCFCTMNGLETKEQE
jgi:NinB protein